MERKIIYDISKSDNGFKLNTKTFKYEYRQKDANVRIIEDYNDLRYCGFGLQPVLSIMICFPDHWVDATKRYKKDGDLEKAEIFINKHLKKNGYKEVSFVEYFSYKLTESGEKPRDIVMSAEKNQGWVMENTYEINHITKKEVK